MAVSFFDMAVSITPPTGHAQPMPIILGPNWQQNDVRLFLISASGIHDAGATSSMMPMKNDPPTGFSTAYAMAPSDMSEGVYYRKLVTGDVDSSAQWPKPKSGWRHFVSATITARGLAPAANPTGGHLTVVSEAGSGVATVGSVAVPSAGIMIFCLGTVPDPGSGGLWPSWSVPMGVPAGGAWRHLVATDNSGDGFYEFDTNNHVMVIARSYASSGATGSVTVPVGKGGPAFAGLWCFVQPAQDVSIAVGAA